MKDLRQKIISAFEALALPTTLGESIAGSALGFQFFFHRSWPHLPVRRLQL